MFLQTQRSENFEIVKVLDPKIICDQNQCVFCNCYVVKLTFLYRGRKNCTLF